jgi:hypothetical protein
VNLTTQPFTRNAARRLAAGLGALAIAATTLLTGASQASADTTVNSWGYREWPLRCADTNGTQVWICLYYSTDANGAIYMGEGSSAESAINGTFRADSFGSAGAGQGVRNNAASMENPTWCTDAVYVSPSYLGDANFVPAGRGGNLTWTLRNNEASWMSIC